jgi:hypothetical protein
MNRIAYSYSIFQTVLVGTTTESYVYSSVQTAPWPFFTTIIEPTLCDGYPRASVSIDLNYSSVEPWPTPVTILYISTAGSYAVYSRRQIPSPTCFINPSDCQSLAIALSTGYVQATSKWYLSNRLTISLASPPISVVINGQTTRIPRHKPYTLTMHNTTYAPIFTTESVYIISDAAVGTPYNKLLTPGGQLTVGWTMTDASSWDFQLPCQLPASVTPSCAVSGNLLAADYAELRYFAPPPITRDLCANTSPGYNRCRCLSFCSAAQQCLTYISSSRRFRLLSAT